MKLDNKLVTKWMCPKCGKGVLIISAYHTPGEIKLVCNSCRAIYLGNVSMYIPGSTVR